MSSDDMSDSGKNFRFMANAHPKYVSAAHVAKFLNCSDRTVRNYCSRNLIPAERTSGGHLRIPLSLKAKWAIDRLKNPGLWKGPVGVMIDTPDETWLVWLQIARAYGFKRPDAPKWNWFKKWVADQMKAKQRGLLESVLIKGCIYRMERNGQRATTLRIAKCAGMSRDTLNRKYVRTGVLPLLRKAVARFSARDVELMKVDDFLSGDWDDQSPGFSIQKR
jgi:excisionase family DNA binding protein